MKYKKALELSTRTYYWKPMTAYFRSIEMRNYFHLGADLYTPTLDLGCGDGGIVRMLREADCLKNIPYGMDISFGELKKAKIADGHLGLFQADANHLPFIDDCFSSIICNGVLCSIPEGVNQSINEINRVLKTGGIFVGTVPTDKFINVLVLPKILDKFSKHLRKLYIDKLNSRLPHFNTYSPREWEDRFERCGLNIIKRETFFSTRSGFIWNILSMQFFRLFGLLKLIRNQSIIDFICGLSIKIYKNLYLEEEKSGKDSGYMFIIAKKRTKQRNDYV